MTSSLLYLFMHKGYILNADGRTGSGFYRGISENVNTPQKNEMLLVFSALRYIVQIFLYTGNSSYARMRNSIYSGVNWTSWVNV